MNIHPDYITVSRGMRGFYAVYVSWDKKDEMYLPWTTGVNSYATKEKAIEEAKEWAHLDDLEYRA